MPKYQKKFLCFFLFILNFYLLSQEIKVNQKEGILQDKKESHVRFQKFKKFDIDLNKVAFKSITKIIIHQDKVFILDYRSSRIFAFDKRGKHLYTIGKPGEGPGDLQYPKDFTISDDGTVYVINSMAKRLEVFSLDGQFKERIGLKLPEEIYYSNPELILVDNNQNFFIAYHLSSHLIDIYDSNGIFLRNLLTRSDPITIPGTSIGNSSFITFSGQGNSILHFNYFTGVFTKVNKEGNIEAISSAYDEFGGNEVEKLRKSLIESKTRARVSASVFQLWSNFCQDEMGNMYVLPLVKKKGITQKLFVFSPEGTLLYFTTIPYFKDTRIDKIFCFGKDFIFVTSDWDIYFAKQNKRT
ncbi:MAG: 6-bladed beta-propeller [Candidatus Aminicenantes bacterium]|nr:6-bladed beta-propeller [Candidatus Aminicenantes bacterium]